MSTAHFLQMHSGILINPLFQKHVENTSVSSTSSDSADSAEDNSSSSSTSNLGPNPRHIRFAPLPDPRSFDDPIDDSCNTSDNPHPDPDDPEHFPCNDTQSEKLYSNPPFQCLPPLIPPLVVNNPPKPLPKFKSWLRPFLKRSSSTPNSPRNSDTEPPSRPSSIHSDISATSAPSLGLPFGRWATTTSFLATSKRTSTDLGALQLKRTQTSQTVKGNVRMPVLSALPRKTSVRKGTRMLNGRVYGGRRPSTAPGENPFANARDDPDPEFVEWGYGGMGSVNADGNSMWKRLQSDSVALGDGAAAIPQREGPGEDDSSGMGWVRKRREQREREKREREEKAALEASGDGDGEAPPPPYEQGSTDPPDATVKSSPLTATLPHTPPPPDESTVRESHNILRAVAVPAPPQRHVRGNSATGASATGSRVNSVADVQAMAVGVVDLEDFRRIVKGAENRDDEDDGDESETDGERSEDDEDDDDDEEQTRKTALCARVEKISRHQDKM